MSAFTAPLLFLLALVSPLLGGAPDYRKLPERIGFGSCANQREPQPILRTIAGRSPDVFVYLGDNVYSDTEDMAKQRAVYATLGARPEFAELREAVPLLATWDDHDFGANDCGAEFPEKVGSMINFRDFWGIGEGHPQHREAGIYGVHRFVDAESKRSMQLIILDSRYFRGPLTRNDKSDPAFKNDYRPDGESESSLLGEAQWKWLAAVLGEEADLRVIASSIQFGHEYNGWESWTNLPAEHEKMLDLLRESGAGATVFISGDVHWGEISRRELAEGWPLYDVTASGINRDWHNVEPNKYRVGPVQREFHFGEILIDWEKEDPEVTLQIVDMEGEVVNRVTERLSGLRP